jgi:RNA polymerase sigma factor (sigma-70 family)
MSGGGKAPARAYPCSAPERWAQRYEAAAQQFETYRAHLRGVAYRMLGSLTDAEDAVQEAWLRLERSGPNSVENLGGWLTTVVARVSLDMLRTRRSRREELIGVRMPAPVDPDAHGGDRKRQMEAANERRIQRDALRQQRRGAVARQAAQHRQAKRAGQLHRDIHHARRSLASSSMRATRTPTQPSTLASSGSLDGIAARLAR